MGGVAKRQDSCKISYIGFAKTAVLHLKMPYIGQNGRMIWFIAVNQFVLNSHDLIPAWGDFLQIQIAANFGNLTFDGQFCLEVDKFRSSSAP